MKRCSIVLVGRRRLNRHANGLKTLGFAVTQADALPDNARLLQFPVVVIHSTPLSALPMTAAHLRCKAAFGRRVIVAMVPDDTTSETIRELLLCGFDEVFLERVTPMALAQGVLERLRARPELRCALPAIPDTPAA